MQGLEINGRTFKTITVRNPARQLDLPYPPTSKLSLPYLFPTSELRLHSSLIGPCGGFSSMDVRTHGGGNFSFTRSSAVFRHTPDVPFPPCPSVVLSNVCNRFTPGLQFPTPGPCLTFLSLAFLSCPGPVTLTLPRSRTCSTRRKRTILLEFPSQERSMGEPKHAFLYPSSFRLSDLPL